MYGNYAELRGFFSSIRFFHRARLAKTNKEEAQMVEAGTMTMDQRTRTPLSVSGTMPLTMVSRDEKRIVCAVRGKEDTRRFLANLGFAEEAEVKIISELGGNLIVAVKGARVAISRAMASRILVR